MDCLMGGRNPNPSTHISAKTELLLNTFSFSNFKKTYVYEFMKQLKALKARTVLF